MSKRTIDLNGWLEVDGNPITKAGVFPYLGSEIGADDASKIYYVYRPAEELQKQETIDSFKLIPFIDDHELLGLDATPAERKGIQGMVGERVYYDDPYLRGNLKVLSDSAQALIKSGKIELSPGYRCRYEFTQGSHDGVQYDAIQRDLRANHLALVQQGRTGRDVSVLDHLIITIDTAELVKMDIEEIKEAIAKMSDEDKAELRTALGPVDVAVDEAEEVEKLGEEVVPAVEAVLAAAEEVVTVAEEAVAVVEEDDTASALDSMRKKIITLQAALDSGAVMKSIANRDAVAKKLSRFVGIFDHGAMTSTQVAAYGVKKLGIKCAAGTESIALDAWMQDRTPDSERPSTVNTDSIINKNAIKTKWGTK